MNNLFYLPIILLFISETLYADQKDRVELKSGQNYHLEMEYKACAPSPYGNHHREPDCFTVNPIVHCIDLESRSNNRVQQCQHNQFAATRCDLDVYLFIGDRRIVWDGSIELEITCER